MKKVMNAKVCIPVLLILIGLSCVAYATWSAAGVNAWCWKYVDADGSVDGDAHASASWGGMASGSWEISAEITSSSGNSNGNGSGAAVDSGAGNANASLSANEDNVLSGSSAGNISGMGNDGQEYEDDQDDDF